ncbi:MAG: hypothetical protein HY693_02615 [Deltaproteobacteria bacterium]|nr:hypothetical protein [Deltaproteobacteria bacterium]
MKKTMLLVLVMIAFFLVAKNQGEAITFGAEYANPAWSKYLDFPKIAKAFASIGIRSVKIQKITWQDIEPDPPKNEVHRYQWGELDKLINIFQSEGFTNMEIVLEAASQWATRSLTDKERSSARTSEQRKNPSLPPKKENWKSYANFIASIVERYDGDGVHDMPGLKHPILEYEIESEAQGTFFWRATLEEYIELLQKAYQAAKSANPNARIILSGFALGDIPHPEVDPGQRIEMIKDKGGLRGVEKKDWHEYIRFNRDALKYKDYFDVVEFHSGENYPSIYNTAAWIRKEMKRNAYEKAIWAGDSYSTPTIVLGPVTPHPYPFSMTIEEFMKALANKNNTKHKEVKAWYRAEQSRLIVKKIVTSMEIGVERINFYSFVDSPFAEKWLLRFFAPRAPFAYITLISGLLDKDYQPYPAFFTYKLAVDKLKDAKFVKRLPLGSDHYGFEFSSKGRPIYVFWNDKKGTVSYSVGSSFKTIKVTKIVTELNQQNPQVETIAVKDGKVELNLTSDPFFVEP